MEKLNMIEYADVIQNIKRIIDEKGMKQVVVAERAGLSPQQLSEILNDRKLLRVEHVVPIARALGVTINELYAKPS